MNRAERGDTETAFGAFMGVVVALLLLALIGAACWVWPNYNVYTSGLGGQAELRKAEQNRQIVIQEAKAKAESAVLLAEAEVARARGVAAANAIIGDSLKGNEAYLRYLWIEELSNNPHSVIYVPTESGLPTFLEAGRGVEIRPAPVPTRAPTPTP